MLGNTDDLDGWSPQGPVTELSADGCWALVTEASFGRLGVSIDNQPEIFPIYYHSDGEVILFRTAEGTKLHQLMLNRTVVFETDERSARGAWSVVVKGAADVLDDPEEISAADRLPLPPWIPIETFVYVRITPTEIHGRRFLRHVEVERS